LEKFDGNLKRLFAPVQLSMAECQPEINWYNNIEAG
jgi:hypothetical protein